MGKPTSAWKNYGAAATTTIPAARALRRVVVNTGVAAGVVTVSDGNGALIATIDAAAPDIGRQYDIAVDGLSIILSSATLDVTVTYD